MINPESITVELKRPLLDALEGYVCAYDAYQQQTADVSTAEYHAAVTAYHRHAAQVADWLAIAVANGQVSGTLGCALAEAERNREARGGPAFG